MKQLLSILLFGLVACANAQTTFGPVQHSNGVIIRPTNWAVLNSNAINSVIAAEEGHEEHPVLSLPPYGGTLTPPPFGLTIWNDAGVLTVGGNGSNVAIPLTATTNASLLTSGTLADGLLSTNVVLRSTGATDGAVYQAQGGQGVFAAFQTAKFFDFTTNSGPSGAVVISNGTDFTRWRWSIPSWSTAQVIALACAGGGGGSGRRGAADTIAAGGGGGASGAVFAQFYTLPSGLTLDVTIGHGGSGGAAVTTDDTSGNAGSAAGTTLVKSTNSLASPGYFAFDPSWQTAGGGGGGGDTNAAAVGTKAGFLTPSYWLFVDGSAGQSGSVSTNAADGGTGPHAQSGRSGGSINAANQAFNGGRSFGTPTAYNTPYLFPFSQQTNTPFGNGAGGNASTTTNGQPGFNVPPLSGGGGGGGGGASRNGFNSGAGGKGGAGLVRIICF